MTTVLVLGMHRSGTSALSRTLDGLGIPSSRPEHFMRAHPSNPLGHFEVRELADLNDEILNELGGSWRALPPGAEADAQLRLARSGVGSRAKRLAERLLVDGDRFWKDPRLCLLAPFWTDVLDDVAVVVMHRSPAEIAASLQQRNQMPLAHALGLWQATMTAAVDAAAALPNLVVGFDRLHRDPQSTISELEGFLRRLDIAVSHTDVDVIDSSARHHHDASASLDASQRQLDTHLRSCIGSAVSALPDEARPVPATTAMLAIVASVSAATEIEARAERKQNAAALRRHAEGEQSLRDDLEREQTGRREANSQISRYLEPLRRTGIPAVAKSIRSLGRRAVREPESRQHLVRQLRSAIGAGPRPVAPVHLPTSPMPVASLVVPVFGRVDLTSRLLSSLAHCPTDLPYEVVVVDDASADGGATQSHLAACGGVTVVTNPENLGYLRSVNAGVAASTGAFVVLLNNDVEVRSGWIDAMLDEFADPTVGAVGPRMLRPDGTVGEAGSIMWSDGSGYQYGRGQHPESFHVLYPRDVDYCSAACLVVRRELWNRLGGYDARYAPAYYEDADLCFGIREQGYRVRYRPDAVVVHDEGATHGTDLSAGVKANQATNRDAFVEKWERRLATHEPPREENVPRASNRAPGLSMLVVDASVPAPSDSAGSDRMYRLVVHLADQGHRVRFYPADTQPNSPHERHLQRRGVEVAYGDIDSAGFLAQLNGDVDVAIVSRPRVAAQWLELLRAQVPDAAIVYDMVDHHGRREQSRRDAEPVDPGRDEAATVVAGVERLMIESADVTLAVSEVEASVVRDEVDGAEVHVVPTVHDAPASAPAWARRSGVMFVGSWAHLPNRDAVTWLVDEIAPALARRAHDVTVHLVGNGLPSDLGADLPNVMNHGFVTDLDQLYDAVRVVVAPLRYGAGLKGKVGEAVVRGVPVVTTSVGAEGFELPSGALSVADDVEGIVAGIVDLHTDPDHWITQSESGRAAMMERYAIESVGEALEAAIAVAAERRLAQRTRTMSE